MLYTALLIAHIAVLGYWLGSELVINSTYRYVSWSAGMPFDERNRLMDHVMNVDQHVRYALILQAGLGTALAALLGFFPGGAALAASAGVVAAAWLVLAEVTHRSRKTPAGRKLAALDRGIRHMAIAGLAVFGVSALAGLVAFPRWLSLKLLLFAGVIACGVGIRRQLIRFYVTWNKIAADGSSESCEDEIRSTYVAATSILGMLWVFILGIVILSWWKP